MRDDQAPSSLTKSNLASARNIFRASTISDSPPAAAFSPRIPASTPKKVFAPGATPEPSRFRGSTAQATPRGVAATAKDKDLFPMRIASPPKELTGETLARKVPKEWNPKGSIYADQFLADLCPPDFDEEQRRQFFCILDLRRLKYAADEIFARKGWKLNVINFAKEFEKSRSIILLRYGLYEFQNVKPSKEVLKRWRREHGLPEPEEEEDDDATPSKPINKKRKANDDTASVASTSKTRKVFEKDDEDEDAAPKAVPVPAPEPAQNKTKRKASVSDEPETQPFKMSKPSSASSLFQKIANKSTAPAPASTVEPQSTTPKFNPFAPTKPSGSSLAKSVFSNLKAGAEKTPPNGNIFGHLSDSSAKNSGAEADEESDPESEPEDSPEAAPSDGPSLAASGIADNGSQAGSSLFAPKSNLGSGFATAGSSAPGTRESTPGRSLFDRVTKNNEGQPLRSEDDAEASSTPKPSNQTWNPSTTPIKFAPPSIEANGPAKSLFGQPSTGGSGLSFPPKTSTTSSLFGNSSAQSDSELEKTKPASSEQDKAGGESDKENDSQPAKSIFGAKSSVPQSTAGSLFQTQPAASEAQKAVEAPKPATNLFGGPSKPAEQSTPPTTQSSTLFGAKATEAAPEPTKPTSLFGAPATNASTTTSTSSLFGAKPTPSTSNIFGNTSSTPSTNIFGAAKPAGDAPQEKPTEEKSSQPAPTPTFSFGSASSDKQNGLFQSKPLFGAPKSPPSSAPANSMFAGSPMKQDEASPAKKAFPGSSNLGSAPALFSSNLFGAASTPAANSSPATSFGAANPVSDKPANTGFSFTSNASAGSSFNNPFAAGGNADNSTPSFNFGASSTPAAAGGSFQFGASSGPSSQSGSAIFGGQASEAPKPMFGGNTAAAPVFSFGSNSSQPPANNGLSFGSTQANAPQGFAASLQPPTGGASTTGTSKSPFPHRKIAPLKRRI